MLQETHKSPRTVHVVIALASCRQEVVRKWHEQQPVYAMGMSSVTSSASRLSMRCMGLHVVQAMRQFIIVCPERTRGRMMARGMPSCNQTHACLSAAPLS